MHVYVGLESHTVQTLFSICFACDLRSSRSSGFSTVTEKGRWWLSWNKCTTLVARSTNYSWTPAILTHHVWAQYKYVGLKLNLSWAKIQLKPIHEINEFLKLNDGPISRSTDRTKSNPTEGLQKSNLDKLKSIIRKIYWCTLRLGLISTFVNYDFFLFLLTRFQELWDMVGSYANPSVFHLLCFSDVSCMWNYKI